MKKLALFLLLACAQLASAQTPQAISYQAIARDANGKPMPGEDISVEFSILDGSMSGQAVYRERHETETNPFGLFTLEIGRGTPLGGSFAGIDWGSGPKFMRVEINGTLQGTTQLLAVPYALFAEKTKSSESLDLPGAQPGQVLKWDATAQKWLPANDEVGPPNSGLTSVATAAPISGDGTAGNPVTIAPGSIQAAQIANNAITINQLAPGVIPTIPTSLPPSGAAGGDLSGNYPGPTVAKIQGRNVDAAAPTNGQVLKWDGSKWTPQNDIGGGAGDGWGSQTAKTDATLAGDGTTANPLKLAPQGAANGQFLKWNGAAWLPADVTVAVANNSITTNQIVDNSITINDLAPGVIPTTLPPSGAAGGDLSGNYPGPTVAKIQGKAVANTAPTNGQVLQFNGTAQRWEPTTQTGSTGWNLTGNNGTDPASNFIGTTDGQPIVFKVNSMERMRLDNAGRLGLVSSTNGSTYVGTEAAAATPSGIDNSFFGFQAGKSNTSGLSNCFFGDRSGQANTTAKSNSFFGSESGQANTTGEQNCFFGDRAGFTNTVGEGNSFFGTKSGLTNTTGYSNCFFGVSAGEKNTIGDDNSFFGYNAGYSTSVGVDNSFFGTAAGYFNETGRSNSFLGRGCGYSSRIGNANSAIGDEALYSNNSGNSNVALGTHALYSNTSISNLVAVGDSTMYWNTTGFSNTAVGSKSLFLNTHGYSNTAVGHFSLQLNTIGDNNTAIGDHALESNAEGSFNTAIGSDALRRSTFGINNTAIGYNSLNRNMIGRDNVATGILSLESNTTGGWNTATGSSALLSNSSGNSNVAIGAHALYSNTTTSNLVAVGDSALYSNTGGLWNTAIGSKALYSNTIGNGNTASGYQALFSNTTGFGNTASGHESLYNNLSGQDNTANGYKALQSNSNGSRNTAIGNASLAYNTSGNNNTSVGQDALSDNITGSNNTALGYQAGPLNGFNGLLNTIAMGFGTRVSANNTARIGNASVTTIGGQVNWTALSDQRIKTAVQENIPGLAFIQKLRPVSYRYDIHRQNALAGIVDTAQWEGKYDIEKIQFSGFLAQEVEQAARAIGYDFSGVDAPKNERSLYGLRYAEFTVPLVKAVQEQQQIIEAQRQQLEAQGKLLAGLAARLEALEAAGRSEKVENR